MLCACYCKLFLDLAKIAAGRPVFLDLAKIAAGIAAGRPVFLDLAKIAAGRPVLYYYIVHYMHFQFDYRKNLFIGEYA